MANSYKASMALISVFSKETKLCICVHACVLVCVCVYTYLPTRSGSLDHSRGHNRVLKTVSMDTTWAPALKRGSRELSTPSTALYFTLALLFWSPQPQSLHSFFFCFLDSTGIQHNLNTEI